jgi:hypothetical protein
MLDRLKERGDKPFVEILSTIANDVKEPTAIRVQAAAAGAAYQSAKLGLVPALPPLIFLVEPVVLPFPHVASIADCMRNIEYISALRREAKLDQAAADALVNEQRLLCNALDLEIKQITAQGGPKDQQIQIVGGLPELPGTNILMPLRSQVEHPAVINGEAVVEEAVLPRAPTIPAYPGWPDPPKKPDEPSG